MLEVRMRIGVMQGRLSARPAARLQVFPRDWQRELEIAASLGFEFVEWLLLPEAEGPNPLDSEAGRREVRSRIAETGLPIASVCAARFASAPFGGLPATIAAAADIGARRVLVPLLEEGHVRGVRRQARVAEALGRGLAEAERSGITLVLEMEAAAESCLGFLERLAQPRAQACYDTGNSTALGLDIATDVRPLLPFLGEVHVKDRLVAGPSLRLGDGHTDFAGFFSALREGSWRGDLVLEHFFLEDPVQEGRSALRFVQGQLALAGLGTSAPPGSR